jgi:GNAT superfamily N-acetyltransferase
MPPATALPPDQRRALEEAAARAWPPHATLERDGWTLRFSGGGSQRANSVQSLHWTGSDIDAAITAAEADYRARNLRPIFQVVDISEPRDLDARLDARGYTTTDRTLLMTKELSSPVHGGGGGVADGGGIAPLVTRHPAATEDWLAIYLSVVTPDRRATAPAIIAALPEPKTFFTAHMDGAPAAVGLGVAEPPYCGVECMATLAAARGQGGARAVMQDLENWAAEQGATTLWLQVLEANTPARRLYDGLGFTTRGAYWYRHAP